MDMPMALTLLFLPLILQTILKKTVIVISRAIYIILIMLIIMKEKGFDDFRKNHYNIYYNNGCITVE